MRRLPLDLKTPPPLALYIHIPWCVKKCPYCDFNSHVHAGEPPEKAYIEALLRDLDLERPAIGDRPVESIFIGGGTPSLFRPESLARLLDGIRARLELTGGCEITMEANPGTFEQHRFEDFRACGINRLSIGVQSFNPGHLKTLGRIHDAAEAVRALETARRAGFDNLNLDLMYGLPGQTAEQARRDLETAIALAPEHISHYQLTIEPDTAFHARPPELPTDDRIWTMQKQCQRLLRQAGYTQYEVSAYAKNRQRCMHNLNYWQFGDYLGIGAGAHQKLTLLHTHTIERRWKQRLPQQYLARVAAGDPVEGRTVLSGWELGFEFMLNALRLNDGVDASLFSERTGLPLSAVAEPLETARQRRLLEPDHQRIRPTELGRRFLNDLLLLFMAESPT